MPEDGLYSEHTDISRTPAAVSVRHADDVLAQLPQLRYQRLHVRIAADQDERITIGVDDQGLQHVDRHTDAGTVLTRPTCTTSRPLRCQACW
jgi:hypothetical protein